MSESTFYTKGDKNLVIKRVNQISKITIYCPLKDPGVLYLRNTLITSLPGYMFDVNEWYDIPSFDAMKVLLVSKELCKTVGYEVDPRIVSIISGCFVQFPNLQHINFEFVDDDDIYNLYKDINNKENNKSIYKIEKLEINFSDIFSQEIIDFVNRIMIMNEIIPNSYLKRKFKIDFSFDEYVNFMKMVIENNHEKFNSIDENICDYLLSFPTMIDKNKPDISIVTNYTEL